MKQMTQRELDKIEENRKKYATIDSFLKGAANAPGGMQRMVEFVLNMKELKGEPYAASLLHLALTISNLHNLAKLVHPLGTSLMESAIRDVTAFGYYAGNVVPQDLLTAVILLAGDADDIMKELGKPN